MTHRTTLSRRQFLALTGGVSSTLLGGALLSACAPAAGPAASTGDEGAAPAATTTELITWFTDRTTINRMTEEEAIPDFESQHPEIQVTLQFVPEGELQQKLLTANAAGNAPDVSSIDETFLDVLTKQNVLRPVPEEVIDVNTAMGELTSFLYRLPQGADDGRYYGLPNGTFGSVLYYNNGLLEELGYTPEDIPTTWDDYLVWASEVTEWDGDRLARSGMAFFAN
jgi:multiple sugar transport system substrate-binding protein